MDAFTGKLSAIGNFQIRVRHLVLLLSSGETERGQHQRLRLDLYLVDTPGEEKREPCRKMDADHRPTQCLEGRRELGETTKDEQIQGRKLQGNFAVADSVHPNKSC